MTESATASPALTPEQINNSVHYLMYSAFARTADVPVEAASEAEAALHAVGAGFTVRGWYDVAGFRADADVLLWSHAPSSDTLQDAYEALRATRLGHALRPVWSQVGLHRPAEFNKMHVPAFLSGEQAHHYLCVYPFVRSREWYLLPDSERSEMLREHGMMARPYPDVRANTVASFALGDYEWLLGFEAEELHRIVDLMRDLRKARARAHMREELPFFTGRRRELAEILASWNGASWNGAAARA